MKVRKLHEVGMIDKQETSFKPNFNGYRKKFCEKSGKKLDTFCFLKLLKPDVSSCLTLY